MVALIVDEVRTWRANRQGDGVTAENYITLNDTDIATVAFDFTEILNPGTALASVTSVIEETANSVTIGTPALSSTNQQVHTQLSTLTANTTSTLRCIAVTSDGDTLAVLGTLLVE